MNAKMKQNKQEAINLHELTTVNKLLKNKLDAIEEENKRLTEALESTSIELAQLHHDVNNTTLKYRYEALFHKDIFELHKMINIEAEKGGKLCSITNNINGTIAFIEYKN